MHGIRGIVTKLVNRTKQPPARGLDRGPEWMKKVRGSGPYKTLDAVRVRLAGRTTCAAARESAIPPLNSATGLISCPKVL